MQEIAVAHIYLQWLIKHCTQYGNILFDKEEKEIIFMCLLKI